MTLLKSQGTIFNYRQCLDWVDNLVRNGKTSGNVQSEVLFAFKALNQKRMARLDRTIDVKQKLIKAVLSFKSKQIWYVIAEPWCGDCAQLLPLFAKIAASSSLMIELRSILRDENPEWMEKYHTNGSKSVPKLIVFNVFGNERFIWGARPEPALALLNQGKIDAKGRSWNDFEKALHLWYTKDKTLTTQAELYEILFKTISHNPGELMYPIYFN
jgi:thiol-disulfide isomerase/thioredoxin